MPERPYTLLSCGVSLDGYLDGATGTRLVLSNAEDLDRVDEVRSGCDAILVGAGTLRHDDPRLLVRDPARRRARTARGLAPSPVRVVLTATGDLPPDARLFTTGGGRRLVYCPTPVASGLARRLAGRAEVVGTGPRVHVRELSEDLHRRGIGRLMVEGGGRVLTQFLEEDLADELQLAVAPFFVGTSRAVRFVGDGLFPFGPGHRARLLETRPVGDVVLLRYALSERAAGQGVPPARVRTQVSVPLELADGFSTPARVITFTGLVDGREHLAIALGGRADHPLRSTDGSPPLVRLHSECLTGDVLGSQRCDCGSQLRESVERISDRGGYLLYLRQEGRGIGLYAKIDAYALQDTGLDTYDANLALGFRADERDYTVAAQMLLALGEDSVALLTNNPDKATQLERHGVRVSERLPTAVHLRPANAGYLAAKASRGAHTLSLGPG